MSHQHDHNHVEAEVDEPIVAADGPAVPGEVNVIFRGLFLFVQRKDMIDILIPNLGAEHVYRAGLFLGETQLAQRPINEPYVLLNVTPGESGFHELSFEGYDYRGDLDCEDVWARLVLPRPKELISLRSTQSGVSAIDPFDLVNGRDFKTVHVLRYDADDLRIVHLFHHSEPDIDDPGTHEANGRKYLNLHVLSEPEALGESMDHPIHGFARLVNLLQGLVGTVTLTDKQSTTLEPVSNVVVPALKGFAAIETSTYGEQKAFAIAAGKKWREDQQKAFSLKDFLVESPPNGCLPGTAGHK